LRSVSDPFDTPDPFAYLVVCTSQYETAHIALSTLAHLATLLASPLTHKLLVGRSRDKNNNNVTQDDDESDDPEGDSPATRVLRNQIAKHYLLVWASILTLPEGWQLDLWLCLMLFMDSWPLVYGIFRAHRLSTLYPDCPVIVSVEEVCHVMRRWSPACRFNRFLIIFFDGCLFTHASALFVLTTAVVSLHSYLFRTIYCTFT